MPQVGHVIESSKSHAREKCRLRIHMLRNSSTASKCLMLHYFALVYMLYVQVSTKRLTISLDHIRKISV